MMPFRRQRPERRCLVFAPLAYLKLQYLCHIGLTEVGAFGISGDRDPLYITDLMTVKQYTTAVSVEFDDAGVADFFDQCVDQGLKPHQFSRIWVHSHPGSSAVPSSMDEATFQRVFGRNDWAVMAILSREGTSYARLRVNSGPGATCRLRWQVDWAAWPEEASWEALPVEAWQQEYEQNVFPQFLPTSTLPLMDPAQLQSLDEWYSMQAYSGDIQNEPVF